jgi:predicted metalloprotease with PDZ domain
MTYHLRAFRLALVTGFILIVTAPAFGSADRLRIDYTVEVASVEDQLFRVTADVRNIRQPWLDLSLPTWTPGWYTVENYAKNILRFRITDDKGNRLPHHMTRKQTWRVRTAGLDRIKAVFDYHATVLALNQAKISKDFAFFTGIELFLMAEGHRDSPSEVRFQVPEGWKAISALKETADPLVFIADDYDTLVDAPTQLGTFDVTKFEVEGKPHYFVATPAGTFSKEKTDKFCGYLARIASSQSSIFGGLPYEKYVYFYFFQPAESNAGGALEHENSHVAFAPPGNVANPDNMTVLASHEFFHTWNVKRIRPKEMWPYDYSRENETPLLWVSEGFTTYYAFVAVHRAGLMDRDRFLEVLGGSIMSLENNEARPYISPADSSTSTWLGYDTPVAFGISYYTQGQVLGALLDLSILKDTRGRSGLDALMRSLYNDFYLKNRGFSTQDLLATINRISGRDYSDFFRKYVSGVEVPDYDTFLGYAGYRMERKSRKVASLGLGFTLTTDRKVAITRIAPDSPAAEAGLQTGDLILKVEGRDPRRGFSIDDKIGQTVKLDIKRGNEEKSIDVKVGSREEESNDITEVGNPSPAQLKVRVAWLKVDKK